ncbi:hypothetical protein N431DRAFT_525741 [Stipitochalara longipes BDJ]|nr:hypothetical protein N431DRAFT_525741 [Stipitochalara longipes BDJ]
MEDDDLFRWDKLLARKSGMIITDTNTTGQSKDIVLIRYWMLCGNPNSDEPMKSFTFLQPVPHFVCKPFDKEEVANNLNRDLRDQPEEFQNWVAISKDLMSRYGGEVMDSQPWSCVVCKKPSTTLRSSHATFLSPQPGASIKGFIPMILSVAIPVCPRSDNQGVCSDTGHVMARNYAVAIEIHNPWRIWDQMKACQKCKNTSNIQLCGGCKLVGYCSKECQTQSWASHKEICKLAKKNKEMKWDT